MNKHSCPASISFFLLVVIFTSVNAQQGFEYREYDRDICISTERVYARQPDDLVFQVERVNDSFYAVFNNEEWFDGFFSDERRHLGVQLVSTEFFACNRMGFGNPEDFFHFLEPLSWRDMKRLQFMNTDGLHIVPLGDVPARFTNKDFDHGVIIGRRSRACIDHWYSNRPLHDWDLLPNSLWIDTLIRDNTVLTIPEPPAIVETGKVLQFDVIFPKNEVTYDVEALRRFLHDLPLISHEPVRIHISAFASIEGPEDRNKELYQRRADVVLREVRLILPPETHYEISVDENWQDFYRDVARSPQAFLLQEEPDAIREYLQDPPFLERVEPLLARHRKATVTVELLRSISTRESSLEELTDFYISSLITEEKENALHLQNALFERFSGSGLKHGFPDSLPLPRSKRFVPVYNRDYALRYRLGLTDIRETHRLFSELVTFFPDDPALQFNLAELSFRKWLAGDKDITEEVLLQKINALPDMGVPQLAYSRLLINYHLVKLRQGVVGMEPRQRMRRLSAVRNLYGGSQLNDDEIINLSMFFVAYHQPDMAERLLRPFARAAQPDEDILFYYIKLTISEGTNTNMRWYFSLLEKAQEVNPIRFCALFQPVGRPGAAGISLLFRDAVKDFYCKHCEGPS